MADLGIKALSKAVSSKHSITLEHVNMDEERVEDAQQDVAMFWDSGSRPEVRDGWQDRQLIAGDRRFETFAETVKQKEYYTTGESIAIASLFTGTVRKKSGRNSMEKLKSSTKVEVPVFTRCWLL